ncbi:alkene reductase [Pedobacter jamesrossensis]|uniref:Alkene reductase n=1 Tax=Pedobacter jamesrossensis TaxID=1908238 RepID=A0ABV8NJM1_9SPHI
MKNLKSLFRPYLLGNLELANKIVMAPMTRARACNEELVPTDEHLVYYAQRSSAGLIISESVPVSKNGIGAVHIPGIYTQIQVDQWKKVTAAVHSKKGHIFVQLVHCGSVSNRSLLSGKRPCGPSAVNPMEQVHTLKGAKNTVIPKAFSKKEIKSLVAEFKHAAISAMEADFDGIELHAQLYTLIPQFLSPLTNLRHDEYGGNIPNRARVLFEILEAVSEVWRYDRIGIKFAPAAFNKGLINPGTETLDTFKYLLKELSKKGLAYIHLVGPARSLLGTALESIENGYFEYFRNLYKGTLIANKAFGVDSAEEILVSKNADLVSFGVPFIANPDLVDRFRNGWELSTAESSSYYSLGTRGYTDYPNYLSGFDS